MDPIGNQPAQPNPQPPVPPTPTPAPSLETPRPEPVSPPAVPAPERPVEAWPPAGTPAAAEAEKIAAAPAPTPVATQPTQKETETIGTEVAEAAGAIPVVAPPPAPNPGTSQGMDGFVSPAAKEIKDSVAANVAPTESPMSDTQADKLFQEEPTTKARNKHHKVKKVVMSLLILVVVLALAAGAYIFFFGNKAAQSYSNTSSVTVYKDSFSQIEKALGQQPIDNAELEAGFSKLKVASENSKALRPVVLGTLNPNYKKAKQLADLEVAYKAKAESYQSKYAAYSDYLKALSDSFVVVSSLDELKDIDLTTTTAEKMTTDMGNLLKDCSVASKALGQALKPSDLSTASKSLSDNLIRICTESIDSLEDGPIVLLVGKTGVLSAEDQAKMRLYLDSFGGTTVVVSSQEVDPNSDIESLTKYQQAALEDASTLLQEAEAILKG